MHIIEMPLEIFVGFERLFPKLRLPHAAATVAFSSIGLKLFASARVPANSL